MQNSYFLLSRNFQFSISSNLNILSHKTDKIDCLIYFNHEFSIKNKNQIKIFLEKSFNKE